MRIYEDESKRVLKRITIYLTPEEASDLAFSAKDLSEDPQKQHHHVTDNDYSAEITIAVYTPETMALFDDESKRIIETGKR